MEAVVGYSCIHLLAVLEVLDYARVQRVVGVVVSRTHTTHAMAVTFSIFGDAVMMILLLLHGNLLFLDGSKVLRVGNAERLLSSVVSCEIGRVSLPELFGRFRQAS